MFQLAAEYCRNPLTLLLRWAGYTQFKADALHFGILPPVAISCLFRSVINISTCNLHGGRKQRNKCSFKISQFFLSRSLYNTTAKKTLSALDLWWNIAIKGRVFSAKCISAVGSNLSTVCSVLLFLLKACWQVRGQMEMALSSPGASQKQSEFCRPQKFSCLSDSECCIS